MPITRAELDRGRTIDSLTDRVYAFLAQNPGTAFTAEDVAVGIGHVSAAQPSSGSAPFSRWLAVVNVQDLLNGWVREGLIVGRNVQNAVGTLETYYSAK